MQNDRKVLAAGDTRNATRKRAWAKAKGRVEAAIDHAKIVSKEQSAAELRAIAARKALSRIALPKVLTVEVSSRVRFEDSLGESFDRQGQRSYTLKSEEEIGRFAKGDEALRQKLLSAFRGWLARRAPHEQTVRAVEAEAKSTDRKWQKAISRHDASLLRLLQTPSPTLSELAWKVQTLREENCSDDVEQAGWAFVVREMAIMSGARVEPLLERI